MTDTTDMIDRTAQLREAQRVGDLLKGVLEDEGVAALLEARKLAIVNELLTSALSDWKRHQALLTTLRAWDLVLATLIGSAGSIDHVARELDNIGESQ